MLQKLSALILVLFIAGCAATKPIVPDDFKGPTAFIYDSGTMIDSSKAKIFYVSAVDGVSVVSSEAKSRNASRGQGFRLTLSTASRRVFARPIKITLVASNIVAAPIQEIASRAAGTFFSVSGTVDFVPAEDGQYDVVGTLEKGNISVWIENSKTKERVSEVIREK
jgi:hypothetical protein